MTYTEPLTLLFLAIIAVGLFKLRRHYKSFGWWVAVAGFFGMAILTWPPAVDLLAQPLTHWYPKKPLPSGSAEAIVVLSGSVDYPNGQRPYIVAGRDTYRRVLHAAWLYKNWKPLPVLTTGGSASTGEPLAVIIKRMLEQEGVPPNMIWTEEQSRSTHENALYGSKVLYEHGVHEIALVVEADSMLRAEKCFRKQGLKVTPAPCLFRDIRFAGEDLVPGWPSVYRAEVLFHEGVGLVWYWLRGWI
jgi:uncharacterized SAM-binding protein YcdF (DUF218 family)